MADCSVLVLSDFNAGNLAAYLTNDGRQPRVEVRLGPIGRGAGLLLATDTSAAIRPGEDVVVWTRPQCVSTTFASMLAGDDVKQQDALDDVDVFARALLEVAQSARTVLLPTWVMPHAVSSGLLAMREGTGPLNTLMRMTLRLAERLAICPNAFVLDSGRWMQAAGADAHSPRLWHMGKIPFGNAVFKAAVDDIKAALRTVGGEGRKLVVVDLDDTLWGGVLGDVGWQNLRVGGHDATGEAHADFQRGLKALARRGIVLGIVSKNDESRALDALASHNEMILRPEDFAGWRINWEDKAANVANLASSLNVGLQSVVFIDDNPVERDRVRQALPEVLVPDWPANPMLFPSALAALDCFETVGVTAEDRLRGAAYRTAHARERERELAASLDEWLRGLQLRVDVNELGDANALRVTQLLNKTNQMNLSTRRLTESELRTWASAPGRVLWAFRLVDKFEDAGLTGILSLECDSEEARIVDFVLSCRVIGRQLEETMVYQAVHYARSRGLKTVSAEYIPTSRNAPCLRFLERSGFENGNGHTFRWNLDRPYTPPRHVELRGLAE